jgi:hypothetical protein
MQRLFSRINPKAIFKKKEPVHATIAALWKIAVGALTLATRETTTAPGSK